MRESISAIAAERKEAAAAAERDTFEYERTMEQMRSVVAQSEARERETVAKHLEKFSADRRAGGGRKAAAATAAAPAAAPAAAATVAAAGVGGWETREGEEVNLTLTPTQSQSQPPTPAL